MRKPVSITAGILFILTLLIFLLSFVFNFSFFQGFFQSVFSAPKSFIYHIIRDQNGENAEIKRLRLENLALNQKLADYQDVKNDNDALRGQFEEASIPSQKLIAAKIVGFLGTFNAPSALIINKGKDENIRKGQTVIFKKNLVGIITDVTPHFSTITLATNSLFSTVVLIGKSQSAGIATGHSDFILLDHVVITDTITKGDIITTKGEIKKNGIGIYPGIIVGKIRSINKTETKPFQNAEVTPLIDYSRLVEVFVITS